MKTIDQVNKTIDQVKKTNTNHKQSTVKGLITMAKVKATTPLQSAQRKTKPALTPEARENQIFGLAMDLIEQRIKDGTATSQETTAIVREFSRKKALEMEKLEKENELLRAKTEAINSQKESRADYKKVLEAMGIYNGHDPMEDDEPDEYDY